MNENNLTIVPIDQLPQVDPPKKKERVLINTIQDNLIKLLERDNVEMAVVQRETGIPWGTFYGWYKKEMAPLLDLNIKELADFFDVSVDFLAFSVKKYKFDTFDKEELKQLKSKESA